MEYPSVLPDISVTIMFNQWRDRFGGRKTTRNCSQPVASVITCGAIGLDLLAAVVWPDCSRSYHFYFLPFSLLYSLEVYIEDWQVRFSRFQSGMFSGSYLEFLCLGNLSSFPCIY